MGGDTNLELKTRGEETQDGNLVYRQNGIVVTF